MYRGVVCRNNGVLVLYFWVVCIVDKKLCKKKMSICLELQRGQVNKNKNRKKKQIINTKIGGCNKNPIKSNRLKIKRMVIYVVGS